MNTFFEQLEQRARAINSLLCVGLDPHPADLPADTPEAAEQFCLRLVEATAEAAAAFKPNAAFFEAYGPAGVEALQRLIAAIPPEIPVVLDAKRGDIASSAEGYARAAFTVLGAGAITLSPYLGWDSIEPFLTDSARGIFVLCKTSNPGSGDLQDLVVRESGLHIHEEVARLAARQNRPERVGLVVGATFPEELRRVRAQAPDLWILSPGVGAQGGDLVEALYAGLRHDGLGLLIPVSRGISRAADPRRAALDLREAIRQGVRETADRPQPARSGGISASHHQLAEGLLEVGCVKFGSFRLKSGLESPIYIDLRLLASAPGLLSQAAEAYRAILRELSFDRLAALPYAALPIGTAISLASGWPMIYPRKEVKEYGTRAGVEGIFTAGERVVVIDDLATTGGSKFEAIAKLREAGLEVQEVVVLIDRQSGAAEALSAAGYRLHSVFTLAELLDLWEASGRVSQEKIAETRRFLEANPG